MIFRLDFPSKTSGLHVAWCVRRRVPSAYRVPVWRSTMFLAVNDFEPHLACAFGLTLTSNLPIFAISSQDMDDQMCRMRVFDVACEARGFAAFLEVLHMAVEI